MLAENPNRVQNQPFSLIHIHKQSFKDKSNGGLFESQRNVNCYFRVCCIGNNINNIKYFVDKYTENVYLTIYKGDSNKERDLIFKWKPYSSFDKMMLSDTDHFLIYCRNTPIEYASLDDNTENLFVAPFHEFTKDHNAVNEVIGKTYGLTPIFKLSSEEIILKMDGHFHQERDIPYISNFPRDAVPEKEEIKQMLISEYQEDINIIQANINILYKRYYDRRDNVNIG